MRSSVLILLIPFLALAQEPANTVKVIQDSDVGEVFTTPLDATAKAVQAPAPVTSSKTESPATKPSPAAESAKAAPTPTNAAGSTAATGAALLPPMPESQLARVTQLGGLTVRFDSTPLDQVIRVVSRDLDRPLHYAVTQQIRISGEWSATPAATILKDIADKYGLRFVTAESAYILDDHGRAMPVGVATVATAAPSTAGRSVIDMLQADTTVKPVTPLEGKAAEKALAAIARDEAKAQARRQRLLQELGE
ncbi:MAG: hypothetical protein PHE83_15010 [Opitutaceae bacterium]|nr:hypothetical protein [Opitutaceae bacterium]